ncbi:hypothetical protein Q9L58_004643 [Maublancomyces gigas]|uniref:HNH nuclease domain-containing protein n=1 Tax=Discina gigas TaxID=1032678 RepID=A0ABR3GKK0_9PEZI
MPLDDHVQGKLERSLYQKFNGDPDVTVVIFDHTIRAIDVVDSVMYFAFPSQGHGGKSGAECIASYLLQKGRISPFNLRNTAKIIIEEFIKPLRNKGASSKDTVKDEDDTMERDSSFRSRLLERDEGCCVVTGYPDRSNKGRKTECHVRLEGAHIFPSALRDKAVSASEMIRRFCADRDDCYLFGTSVDETYNGISLQHDAHGDFDDYLWSLERVGNGNEYRVEIMVGNARGLSFDLGLHQYIKLKGGETKHGPAAPAAHLLQLHLQFSRLLMFLRGR